jgi:hypothetical protein
MGGRSEKMKGEGMSGEEEGVERKGRNLGEGEGRRMTLPRF